MRFLLVAVLLTGAGASAGEVVECPKPDRGCERRSVTESVSRRAGYGKPLLVLAASFADGVASERRIADGRHLEGNPVLGDSRDRRIATKAAVGFAAAGAIWSLDKRGHKGWAKVLTVAAVVYYGWATVRAVRAN